MVRKNIQNTNGIFCKLLKKYHNISEENIQKPNIKFSIYYDMPPPSRKNQENVANTTPILNTEKTLDDTPEYNNELHEYRQWFTTEGVEQLVTITDGINSPRALLRQLYIKTQQVTKSLLPLSLRTKHSLSLSRSSSPPPSTSSISKNKDINDINKDKEQYSLRQEQSYTAWNISKQSYIGGFLNPPPLDKIYQSPIIAKLEYAVNPISQRQSYTQMLKAKLHVNKSNEQLYFLYLQALCENDPIKAIEFFIDIYKNKTEIYSYRIAALGDYLLYNTKIPLNVQKILNNIVYNKNKLRKYPIPFVTRMRLRKSLGTFIIFILTISFQIFLTQYIQREYIDHNLGSNGKNVFTIYDPLQDPNPTLLDDVLGIDEVIDEIKELVDMIKNRNKYIEQGAQLPKGILLSGPPGTGKTMLARAIAGECGIPFIHCPASSFDNQVLGSGKDRIRKLFSIARRLDECIVFIDEIDTLGKRNEAASYSNMTLNTLLVELDGFIPTSRITVIAATNVPSLIDSALIRPGRLGKHLHIPLPDILGRERIIKHYLNRVIHDKDIDIRTLARGTVGSSGAFLKTMINQAAFEAARRGGTSVSVIDIENAKDKLQLGHPRDNFIMPISEAKKTAYHEGGHAQVALKTDGSMPIYKATIMPRGSALGYVYQVPDKDVIHMTNQQMQARIDVALAGRAAEEIIYGSDKITTGCSNDLENATELIMYMITDCGFSKLGIINEDYNTMSDSKKHKVEKEAVDILQSSYKRVKQFLIDNITTLHHIAEALLEHETLDQVQLHDIANGNTIVPYEMGQSLRSL